MATSKKSSPRISLAQFVSSNAANMTAFGQDLRTWSPKNKGEETVAKAIYHVLFSANGGREDKGLLTALGRETGLMDRLSKVLGFEVAKAGKGKKKGQLKSLLRELLSL